MVPSQNGGVPMNLGHSPEMPKVGGTVVGRLSPTGRAAHLTVAGIRQDPETGLNVVFYTR